MDPKPLTENEKRFVLAEAFRTSSIPLERMYTFVNDNVPAIAWDEIMVPTGRNLKQCKDAFKEMRASPLPVYQFQNQSQHLPAPSPTIPGMGIKRKSPANLEPFSAPPASKRRQSGEPVTTARDIRPKPASNGSPLSMTSFAPAEPKKRGRPSKKDVERKQAEAIARGDILPPVSALQLGYGDEDSSTGGYATILPTPTLISSGPMHALSPITPTEKEVSESTAESPGKKRRAKAAPKPLKAISKQPGESSFLVNPTISQLIEHQEPAATPPIAPSQHGLLAGPIEVVGRAPSNLPIASAELPPIAEPQPTAQPPLDK